jgi:hypothetical protein
MTIGTQEFGAASKITVTGVDSWQPSSGAGICTRPKEVRVQVIWSTRKTGSQAEEAACAKGLRLESALHVRGTPRRNVTMAGTE